MFVGCQMTALSVVSLKGGTKFRNIFPTYSLSSSSDHETISKLATHKFACELTVGCAKDNHLQVETRHSPEAAITPSGPETVMTTLPKKMTFDEFRR